MSGPSALEYARYYLLAADARSEHILGFIKCDPVPDDGCLDLLREPSGPDHNELLRDDKLHISREALALLAECTKTPPAPDRATILGDSQSAQRLKLEMPMLISDHARDMKWFEKGVDLQKLLQNCRETSKLESPEMDSLPDIAKECERNVKSINTQIQNERLETTLNVLKVLTDCSRDTWKEQDMEDIVKQDLKSTKPHGIQALTPLLTPHTYDNHDALSFSPISQFDLEPRSECSLEADDVLMHVDRTSTVESQVCTSEVGARSSTAVRATLDEASMSPSIDLVHFPAGQLTILESTPEGDQCFISHGLKVEVPMMPSPPQSEQEPKSGKRVPFKNVFEGFIELASQGESRGSSIVKEESEHKLLILHQGQHDADLKEEIVTAKPDINDQALKLQVSKLDDVNISDPRVTTTFASMVVQTIKETRIKSIQAKDTDETKLNWVPIPQELLQIDMAETVDTSVFVEQLVEKPDNILRSKQLLYKEPGLRILDADVQDDGDMEEDSAFALDSAADTFWKTVPRKRRTEDGAIISFEAQQTMRQAEGLQSLSPQPTQSRNSSALPITNSNHHDPLQSKQSPSPPQSQLREQSPASQKDMDDLPEPVHKAKRTKIVCGPSVAEVVPLPYAFSAAGSLESFLDLRGSKFKKPWLLDAGSKETCDPCHCTKEIDNDLILISQTHYAAETSSGRPLERTGSPGRLGEHIEVPSTPNGERNTDTSTSLPSVTHLDGPRTIIMDADLVNNRQLHSFVERQGRNFLTIVYRDLQGKPDVILNPTTCIIYTNFQALTQKSLPGQTPKVHPNTLQDMIRVLALDFELILVMVSLSASLRMQGLGNQSNNMAGFSSFCAALRSGYKSVQVVPLWIPIEDRLDGSSATGSSLCRWTWASICRHAFKAMTTSTSAGKEERIGIIQEETLWELFLRKTGMNAMAAQVVLGRLKRPAGTNRGGSNADEVSMSGRTWGLGKFVSISPEERLALFGKLVGVSALERINNVLD